MERRKVGSAAERARFVSVGAPAFAQDLRKRLALKARLLAVQLAEKKLFALVEQFKVVWLPMRKPMAAVRP